MIHSSWHGLLLLVHDIAQSLHRTVHPSSSYPWQIIHPSHAWLHVEAVRHLHPARLVTLHASTNPSTTEENSAY